MYGDFCNQCPIGEKSTVALTSNCSKAFNQFCPISSSSKICINNVDVSITDYCSYDGGEYWTCPKVNKGLDFEQCYHM